MERAAGRPGAKHLRLIEAAAGKPTPAWEGEVGAEVGVVRLPQAGQLTLEVSSLIEPNHVDHFEISHWLRELADPPISAGRHPMATPARWVHFVHAVRKPLSTPAGSQTPRRDQDETAVVLELSTVEVELGLEPSSTVQLGLGVDPSSTVQLELAAAWERVGRLQSTRRVITRTRVPRTDVIPPVTVPLGASTLPSCRRVRRHQAPSHHLHRHRGEPVPTVLCRRRRGQRLPGRWCAARRGAGTELGAAATPRGAVSDPVVPLERPRCRPAGPGWSGSAEAEGCGSSWTILVRHRPGRAARRAGLRRPGLPGQGVLVTRAGPGPDPADHNGTGHPPPRRLRRGVRATIHQRRHRRSALRRVVRQRPLARRRRGPRHRRRLLQPIPPAGRGPLPGRQPRRTAALRASRGRTGAAATRPHPDPHPRGGHAHRPAGRYRPSRCRAKHCPRCRSSEPTPPHAQFTRLTDPGDVPGWSRIGGATGTLGSAVSAPAHRRQRPPDRDPRSGTLSTDAPPPAAHPEPTQRTVFVDIIPLG